MPDAIIKVIDDDKGERAVVVEADELIWVDPELSMAFAHPDRRRIRGDAEVSGDLLTFGTEGEGLGRLTYRRTGYAWDNGYRFITYERVKPEADRG